MRLPGHRQSSHLPERFPVGTVYVVVGRGGEHGRLRVSSRYVVLPGGNRIDVPADLGRSASARALARRSNRGHGRNPGKDGGVAPGRHKKMVARAGTPQQDRR